MKTIRVNKISYGRHYSDTPGKSGTESEHAAELPDGFLVPAAATENTDAAASRQVLQGRRILMAEGNRLNGEVMKSIFGAAGAEPDMVSDGRQAVIRFISQPAGTYSAVLLDVSLAELSGYDAADCIRICGKDDAETVPLYAIIANATEEDAYRAYTHKFNAVFSRPVDCGAMLKKIREQ